MSKKKRSKIVLSIILITMCLFLTIASIFKSPTMAAAKTYTREYLQETVIATALSYLYNNSYSDYGQTGMDSVSPYGIKVGDTTNTKVYFPNTQNWRTFSQTPEMVSRSNYYYIDCSSFAVSTYLHSLGYDFSEFYEYSEKWNDVLEEGEVRQPVRYFWETSYASSKYSRAQMNRAKQFGKGYNTGFFHAIAADTVTSSNAKPYVNTEDSTSPIAFYYQVTDRETDTEIKNIKKSLKDVLQPGDMIVYQNKTKDSSGTLKKIAGHVLIYVGDIGSTGVNGVIHSSGKDFEIDGDTITIGSDDFSVRYDPYSYVTGHIFQETTTSEGWTKTSNQITVFRPLNTMCTEDGDDDPSNDKCTLKNSSNESINLSENAEARRDLAALQVEQYVREKKEFNDDTTSTTTTKEILKSISEYNSVNKGDYITYSLYLENQADYGACNAWGYHDKESCESNEFTWLNSKRTDDYSGITVTAPIPTNTTFTSGDIEIVCNGKSSDTTCVTTNEDIANNKITFNVKKLTKTDRITIRYKVKVNTDIEGTAIITHTGMKITTPNKKTLTLSTLKTHVNPTLNGINTILMENASEEFTTTITDTTDVEDEFAKSLYKNQVGIELPSLTVNTIKEALFTVPDTITYKSEEYTSISKFYLKNTEEPTDADLKKIYKMQVPNFYGGRHVRSGKDTNRIHYISTHFLEIGDILCAIKSNKLYIFIYFGLDENKEAIVKRYDPNTKEVITYDTDSSTTGWKVIKSLHAADIFTVLRPTRNYGTTINLDYNGGTVARESFVTAGNYNFLPTKVTAPAKNYTITYNYSGKTVPTSAPTTQTTANEFKYWKNTSGSKITNTSSLESTQYHTVTAQYAGKAVTLPNTATTGYKLAGWYTSTALTSSVGQPNSSYSPAKNITLYAKWTPYTYEVKYNSTCTIENSTHTYDVAKNLTNNTCTKTGYTFKGWSLTENGEVVYTNEQSVKNLTSVDGEVVNLYAIWEPITYEVKYNSTCTIENSTHTYDVAKNLTDHTCTKTGYTFKGWSLTENGEVAYTNKKEVQNLTKKNNDTINLYAVWENNTYYIAFHSADGTNKTSRQVMTYDVEATLNANTFERDGYIFKGWSNEQLGKVLYEDKQSVINLTSEAKKDVVLYAIWEITKVTVTFHANDGTGYNIPLNVNYGTFLSLNTLESSFSNPGYQIVGWNSSPDYSGVDYSINGKINIFKDINLYAKWDTIEYWISYKYNNQCTDYNELIKYDTEYQLKNPYSNCSERGYKFLGWSTEPEGEIVYHPGAIVKNLSTKNLGVITLYAQWEPYKYSVKFDSNGGTGTMEDQVIESTIETPLNKNKFTKDNENFLGWSTEKDGDVVYPDEGMFLKEVSEDNVSVTLYAVWGKNQFIISYDDNYSQYSTLIKETVESGSTVTLKNNPFERNGYYLKNWNTKPDGSGTTYNENQNLKITSNITLFAQWEPITYEVKYNSTCTIENTIHKYNEEKKLNKHTCKKDGYIFEGWEYTTSNNQTKTLKDEESILNITDKNNQVITLNAVWKSNFSYEIKNYKVNETKKYIDQVPIHTSFNNYKKNIILGDGYSVSITSNNKNYIATGSKTKIYNSNQTFTYTNIVRGEVTGDGDIDFLDYVTVYNHISKTINPSSNKKLLTNEFLVAADMSLDGEVDFLDYVKIYNKIKELN